MPSPMNFSRFARFAALTCVVFGASLGCAVLPPRSAATTSGSAQPASTEAPWSADSFRAAYLYAVAAHLGLRGDLSGEEALLSRAETADPASAYLALERGRALAALGRGPQSADQIERALAVGGLPSAERLVAADALRAAGRIAPAEAAYRALVHENPAMSEAWSGLAACEEAAGDGAQARKDLSQGLKNDPSSPLLADQWGRACLSAEDYAAAEAAFTQLARLDPGDPHAYLFRGLARLKLGKPKAAEADFRAAGRLAGDDPRQRYALGLALLDEGRAAAAAAEFRKVLRLDPTTEDAWAELAAAEVRRGRGQAAVAALRRGVAALPTSGELPLLLAAELDDLHRSREAVAVLRGALRRLGGTELRFQLAVEEDHAGDFAAAQKDLQALLDEAPKDAEALNYLGYSWVERKERLPEAEALIRRALAVEPDNRYYLDSLGWALFGQGKAKAALDPLERAARAVGDASDADEAVVDDHLAAVAKALGKAGEARDAAARAAAIRARAKAKDTTEASR